MFASRQNIRLAFILRLNGNQLLIYNNIFSRKFFVAQRVNVGVRSEKD